MQKIIQLFKKNTMRSLLLISIVFILVGSLGASYVQTSFRKTQMTKLVFPAQNGQWIAADLFKPKDATKDKKTAVVLIPKFQICDKIFKINIFFLNKIPKYIKNTLSINEKCFFLIPK